MEGLNCSYMALPGLKKRVYKGIRGSEENVNSIINIVVHHFGITNGKIFSKHQTADIVYPRQILMLFFRKYLFFSHDVIGKIMIKDRSTIMMGIKRLKDLMDTEEGVLNEVQQLELKVLQIT